MINEDPYREQQRYQDNARCGHDQGLTILMLGRTYGERFSYDTKIISSLSKGPIV